MATEEADYPQFTENPWIDQSSDLEVDVLVGWISIFFVILIIKATRHNDEGCEPKVSGTLLIVMISNIVICEYASNFGTNSESTKLNSFFDIV